MTIDSNLISMHTLYFKGWRVNTEVNDGHYYYFSFLCICSGVSGSGKSVSASHITAQLCRLATHTKKESRVASQLQQAQQILDAFGCAYTKDNTNASMFSKFLEIQV